MQRSFTVVVLVVSLGLTTDAAARTQQPTSGCLQCHEGIEPVRQPGSKMLAAIIEEGENRDDPAGCDVCHGGDPARRWRCSAEAIGIGGAGGAERSTSNEL